MITEAKKNLQEGLPYIRYAIEQAKKSGDVKLAIVSKLPQKLMNFSILMV